MEIRGEQNLKICNDGDRPYILFIYFVITFHSKRLTSNRIRGELIDEYFKNRWLACVLIRINYYSIIKQIVYKC